MRDDISNSDDIIDSRDLESRIEELDDEQTALIDEYNEAKEEADELADDTGEEWRATERLCNAINALSSYWDITPEEVADAIAALDNPADAFNGNEELHALKEFRDELEPYCPDWRYGVTIIRESYFTDYAEELANDIGAVKSDAGWPNAHIDWEAAAEALKIDYTSGDFDGVTYWAR
jgi:hypothetical protein